MTLYTTKSNLSEIKFYLSKEKIDISGEFNSVESLNQLISSPPFMDMFVSPPSIKRRTYIGALEDLPKVFNCSKHIDVYVSTKSIRQPFLDLSGLFEKDLEKIGFVFSDEKALTYFYDSFSTNPYKGSKELIHILDIFSSRRRKVSIDDLLTLYDENSFVNTYLQLLGTPRGSAELSRMSKSEQWLLCSGDKPTLYSFSLSKKAPSIWHFFYTNILEKGVSLLAVDILFRNQYIIDKKDLNHWKVIKRNEQRTKYSK